MNRDIALSCVVTKSVLQEFFFLKYSFELFHGREYKWFVRCDQLSAGALSACPEVVSRVFANEVSERPDIESSAFRAIASEKISAIADAWAAGAWKSVIFFDADLTLTAEILTPLASMEGDVLLTPNYYPKKHEHFAAIHGDYNSGFVQANTRTFHTWWKDALLSQPNSWTDQAVLNEAGERFAVGRLPEEANIGFWRSESAFQPLPIPLNCMFLHVHFFQPMRTMRQWIDRAFALHCVEFLRDSRLLEHKMLFDKIMTEDYSGWYKAALRIRQ